MWHRYVVNGSRILKSALLQWKWLKNLKTRLKYVGNGLSISETAKKMFLNEVDIWEMAKICLKQLKYLTSGLYMWEMTQRLGKWLKYLGNGLDILNTA